MPPELPIILTGKNLGKRHRELNNMVSEAIKLGEPIDFILDLPDNTPVDRLFKIDLALHFRHLEYIVRNLRHNDMLYVTRALKAKWLLEEPFKQIMNPEKLETYLYPRMIVPAVNKMKHWIHLNLRDENRCQEFYNYYRESDRKLAMKYLLKCPADLIIQELGTFFHNDSQRPTATSQYYINPHYFKMFCERTPRIAKLVYDMIDIDKSFRLSYLDQQYEYFESLKCILKTDPDLFLDIAEKHFNVNQCKRLSAVATRFIINNKKDRFLKKPELYIAWLMDVRELAKYLNSDECEELIIQLARSKFIRAWFNYRNVEPLIKRIDRDKRVEFKKRVFVRKEIGEDIKDWPYTPPGPDIEEICRSYESVSDDPCDNDFNIRLLYCSGPAANCERRKPKSLFDCLFDEYRFKSFTETLTELSKKILAESSQRTRMHMMMVLISKTGGKETNLDALFKFLMRHRNEPLQVRAAVVRSLVRRASIWRASDEVWEHFLQFSEGLGLDGRPAEVECKEGLHAVVIRNLIKTGQVNTDIIPAFLKVFCPLTTEYILSITERSRILQILPSLLMDAVNKANDDDEASGIMEHLLDTLELTKIEEDIYDDFIITVKKLLKRDQKGGKRTLMRLFDSYLGRKDLLKENFDMMQTDDSYVNALKHDLSVLSLDKIVNLISADNIDLSNFLKKLSIYYMEYNGLASRLLDKMKDAETKKNLARPIARLIGIEMKDYIKEMDKERRICRDTKEMKRFCAEIRANAHLARPLIDLGFLTWQQAGAKLMANRILVCRSETLDTCIEQSLLWRRSVRLSTVLAKRTDQSVDVLKAVARVRPTIAIKVALDYFKRDQSSMRIWNTVKPLIVALRSEDKNFYLREKLENFNQVPETIRPEFIQVMFPLYLNSQKNNTNMRSNQKLFYNRVLQEIFNLLPKMDPKFINDLLVKFLGWEFDPKQKNSTVHTKIGLYSDADMYVRILTKYMMICKNENEQSDRFSRLGESFFKSMEIYWHSEPDRKTYLHYLNILQEALRSHTIYFSNEYVCLLPILKNVSRKVRSLVPLQEYFQLYVEGHLNMLYYKALKSCITQKPSAFPGEAKDQKKNKVGMTLVTETFGRFIALDAKDLTMKYFDSIPDLYIKSLKNYFNRFRESRHEMSLALVRGLVMESEGFEGRLAVELFNEYRQEGKDWNKICELMTQKFDNNMMFFYHNDIIAFPVTREHW